MPVEIAGFAQALARCLDFDSVEPPELEEVLSEASEPFEMSYTEPTADRLLIRSGAPFTHLVFIQHGIVVPWQYPHSELAAPFLIGEHELLMNAERWVANYSAITLTTVVQIPVATMVLVLNRIPRVRDRMHQLVTRRLSRFYWTSLATTGTPTSRVAAALVSRLALDDLDHGGNRTVNVKQKDLARLTTMSRSAVADGLADLTHLKAIALGDSKSRFAGVVHVPDVDRLKEVAFSEFRERQLRRLLYVDDDEDAG